MKFASRLSQPSDLVISIGIALGFLMVPALVMLKLVSLNQGVVLSVIGLLLVIFKHLSKQVRVTASFALAMLVVPIPIRFMSGLDLVPFVSAAVLLVAILNRGSFAKANRFVLAFLWASVLFASIALISSFFFWRDLSFLYWVVFPICAAVTTIYISGESGFSLEKFLLSWTFGAVPLLLIDLVGFIRGSYRSTDVFNSGRFLGSLGDYELSAEVYGISALISLYILLVTSNRYLRILAITEITLFAALISATQTRSVFLLLIGGALVLIAAAGFSKYVRRAAVASALLLASAQILLLSPLNGLQEVIRRLNLIELNQDVPGLINRSGVWTYFQSLDSFRNLPILGNGFSYPFWEIKTFPHSLYLWTYWSGGLASTLLLGIILLVATVYSLRRLKHHRLDATMALVILGYLFLDQAKIEVARYGSTTWIFWLLLALTFANFQTRTGENKLGTNENS